MKSHVSFKDGDLQSCDAALGRFEAANGHRQPIMSALAGIGAAGGWKGERWARGELTAGREPFDIAWRWLAVAAKRAKTENPALAARIAFFFDVFFKKINPEMRLFDYYDCGLVERPSDAVYTAVLVDGVTALDSVDPEAIVLRTPDGDFTAGEMQRLLSLALAERSPPDGRHKH